MNAHSNFSLFFHLLSHSFTHPRLSGGIWSEKKCEESGKKRATSTGEILDQCEQQREEEEEKKKKRNASLRK